MGNYYITDEYVAHHGIKGQKWGVRRYQNPDGTLTALGKQLQKQHKANENDYYYKVGAKRLSNRVNKLDKQAKREAASLSRKKQEESFRTENRANTTAGMLNTPDIVKSIGKRTVVNRAVNTTVGGVASGVATGVLAANPVWGLAVGAGMAGVNFAYTYAKTRS